jgi:uncharacterized 2Fe-2S/4Fe-4S cluster protein (DUF4445 family)
VSQEFAIIFAPSGKRGSFAAGTSVLEAARKLGVDLDSVCGGRGICGRCQIAVQEGRDQKVAIQSSAAHVSEFNAVEQRYAAKRGVLAAGRRLGCQAKIVGDLIIDVPPDSQVHKQVVRKRAEAHPITIEPVVSLYYVEVAEPDMHDPASDFRRLCQALEGQWSLTGVRAPLAVLRGLQGVLREGGWRVTVALRHGRILSPYIPVSRNACSGLPSISARPRLPPICAIWRVAMWLRPTG